MKGIHRNSKGFTLIELLIALALSAIVMIAVYGAFSSQEEASMAEQQIFSVQQNLRAALFIMSSEIRMAGFDKSLGRTAKAGIMSAGPSKIRFTMDFNDSAEIGDNDTDEKTEDLSYGFSEKFDEDEDGIADDGVAPIGREACTTDGCGGFQAVADNIEMVRFIYGYDTDDDGRIDGWGVDRDGDEVDLDTDADGEVPFADILAVRITLLGRTSRQLRDFKDTLTYDLHGQDFEGNAIDVDIDGDGASDGVVGPFNDNYRRRVLATTVKCRNMVF